MSHEDIERLVERSLDRRAADLGHPTGQIGDVFQRLDHRRTRRRSVAVVGSLAVVGIGALGLASLDRRPAEQTLPLAAGSPTPDQQAAWRCTDQLAYFDQSPQTTSTGRSEGPAAYFAVCEQVSIDGAIPIIAPPPPTTPPGGTYAPIPTTEPAQEIWYTVRTGDTAESIAAAFGVGVDEITARNDVNPDGTVRLVVGEPILVTLRPAGAPLGTIVPSATSDLTTTTASVFVQSPGEQRYMIEVGDTLSSIADWYEVALEQLVAYNAFDDGVNHLILPGDIIAVPPGARHRPGTDVGVSSGTVLPLLTVPATTTP